MILSASASSVVDFPDPDAPTTKECMARSEYSMRTLSPVSSSTPISMPPTETDPWERRSETFRFFLRIAHGVGRKNSSMSSFGIAIFLRRAYPVDATRPMGTANGNCARTK